MFIGKDQKITTSLNSANYQTYSYFDNQSVEDIKTKDFDEELKFHQLRQENEELKNTINQLKKEKLSRSRTIFAEQELKLQYDNAVLENENLKNKLIDLEETRNKQVKNLIEQLDQKDIQIKDLQENHDRVYTELCNRNSFQESDNIKFRALQNEVSEWKMKYQVLLQSNERNSDGQQEDVEGYQQRISEMQADIDVLIEELKTRGTVNGNQNTLDIESLKLEIQRLKEVIIEQEQVLEEERRKIIMLETNSLKIDPHKLLYEEALIKIKDMENAQQRNNINLEIKESKLVEEQSNEIENLEKHIKILQSEIREIQKQKDLQELKIKQLEKDHQFELSRVQKSIDTNYNSNELIIRSQKLEIETLKQELLIRQEKISFLEKNLEETKRSITIIERSTNINDALQQKLEDAQLKIIELEQTLESRDQYYNQNIQIELEITKKQLYDLKQVHEELEREMDHLQEYHVEQIISIKQDYEGRLLSIEQQKTNAQLNNLEIQQKNDQITYLEKELTRSQVRIEQYFQDQEQVQELREQYYQAQQKILDYQDELQEASSLKIQLTFLQQKNQELTQVNTETIQLTEQLQKAEKNLIYYKQDNDKLKAQLQDAVASFEKLKEHSIVKEQEMRSSRLNISQVEVYKTETLQWQEKYERLQKQYNIENEEWRDRHEKLMDQIIRMEQSERRIEIEVSERKKIESQIINQQQEIINSFKSKYQAEIDRYTIQIDEVQNENKNLKLQINELQISYQTLQDNISIYLEQIDQLKTNNLVLKQQNDQYTYQITKQQETRENDTITLKYKFYEEFSQANQLVINQYEQKILSLEQLISDLQKECINLQGRISTLIQKQQELLSELNSVRINEQKAYMEIEFLKVQQSDVSQYSQEIESLKIELKKKESESNRLMQQIQEVQSESERTISTLRVEINNQKHQMENQKSQFQSMIQIETENNIKALQSEIEQLRYQNNQLNQRIGEQEFQTQQYKINIQTIKEEAQSQIQQEKKSLELRIQEISSQKSIQDIYLVQIKDSEAKIIQLNTELEQLRYQNDLLKQQLSEYEFQIQTYKINIQNLKEEKEQLNVQEGRNHQIKIQEYMQQLNMKETVIKQQETNFQELRNQIMSLETDINRQKTLITQYEKSNSELIQKLTDCESQLNILRIKDRKMDASRISYNSSYTNNQAIDTNMKKFTISNDTQIEKKTETVLKFEQFKSPSIRETQLEDKIQISKPTIETYSYQLSSKLNDVPYTVKPISNIISPGSQIDKVSYSYTPLTNFENIKISEYKSTDTNQGFFGQSQRFEKQENDSLLEYSKSDAYNFVPSTKVIEYNTKSNDALNFTLLGPQEDELRATNKVTHMTDERLTSQFGSSGSYGFTSGNYGFASESQYLKTSVRTNLSNSTRKIKQMVVSTQK